MAQSPPPLAGRKRRICCLTSGGDSPGMNAAVRAVVRTAVSEGCTVFCALEGYKGIVFNDMQEMGFEDVRGLLSKGGTVLGSSRCMEFYERPGRLQAAKNLVLRGIDALVVCGGDGSLTGADKFREEWPGLLAELVDQKVLTPEQTEPFQHLNIVGLVGSIDNDMSSTDATIGCYSSLTRICEAVDSISDTASSHSRAFVVEVMGRHCGWLALMSALSTGADYVFIPENPPEDGWEHQMCDMITARRKLGKRTSVVIVAEGAIDRNLQPIKSSYVKDLLANKLKLDTRITTLGHIQRGGNPCAFDRYLGTLQGVEAVRAILDSTPETLSPVISIIENKIVRKPLIEAVRLTKSVAEAIKVKDFAKAMSLRDAEFGESYSAFRLTTAVEQPKLMLEPSKRMRIGIVHVGAPAGGMNPATRAAVAYCLARGHTPVGLYNGFPGLCRHHDDKPIGSVRVLEWLAADAWASQGGSEIGTNRGLPSADMATTAMCFEKYELDALFVIGGFEAFTAVSELRKARTQYDSLKIPMVVLPATVSNNVPGTEYSLGSDTCLNALITYCDALRQSASSSRRRVFVVETQGGASGFIATLAGLSIGALAVYTPEEGISIKDLDRDIDHLRDTFAKDKGQGRAGKIILRNEKASKVYTTGILAAIINEEARGRFEAREAIPGHWQQGTTPSPMDRVRAVRFGVKSIEHLESFAGKSKDEIDEDPLSAAVIGIRGARVKFSPMRNIEENETDWKNRRAKNEFWLGLKDVVDTLSGRPKKPHQPQPKLV